MYAIFLSVISYQLLEELALTVEPKQEVQLTRVKVFYKNNYQFWKLQYRVE